MTEQQVAIKHLRKQIFDGISRTLNNLSPDQKKRLREFLEFDVDIKKNKITISFPYSYALYLEKGLG